MHIYIQLFIVSKVQPWVKLQLPSYNNRRRKRLLPFRLLHLTSHYITYLSLIGCHNLTATSHNHRPHTLPQDNDNLGSAVTMPMRGGTLASVRCGDHQSG